MARRSLRAGEEVTISYLPESKLFRPRGVRQAALAHWGFHCQCPRCSAPEDLRSFRCLRCGPAARVTEQSSWTCGCGHQVDPEALEDEWRQALRQARRSASAAAALWKSSGSLTAEHYLVVEAARLASQTLDASAPKAARQRWRTAKALLGLSRTAAEALEAAATALALNGRPAAARAALARAGLEASALLGEEHGLSRRLARQRGRLEKSVRTDGFHTFFPLSN